MVARHEAGHALVSTAVAALVPGASAVERLSIIPRSGGALGFTYIPPKSEDRCVVVVCGVVCGVHASQVRGQVRGGVVLLCLGLCLGCV